MARPVDWKPVQPELATSRNGKLQLDADGILSVSGTLAKTEQYTLTVQAPEEPVTGIRLEVFGGAPDSKANYRLSELSVETLAPKPGTAATTPAGKPGRLEIAYASADSATAHTEVEKLVDNDPKTGWAFPVRAAHKAAFELAQPVQGRPLKLVLKLNDAISPAFTRFRVSFTTQPGPVREIPAAIRAILAVEAEQRDPKQKQTLSGFFRPQSQAILALQKTLKTRREALAAAKPVEIPVMKETPGMRKSFLLNKGNYLTPGEEVQAGLPASFHSFPQEKTDRLTLARWLFAPENPLTSRVAVNRFWSQLFGAGLVETEEDFGTQGSWPTHPELLDWLAVHFQTPQAEGGLGWDVKALLKLLVSSHTYRQSSQIPALALQKDPRNVWLSHYTRRRLEAESIRDQALAVSGMLTPTLGGPSVYPPQPDGLWSVAFRGAEAYPTSTGPDRWRRSLYTVWRRIAPNPTMATFDAPSRESCTLRRVPTNTPLQAFVSLNDPVYFEAAQGLARRILREAPGNTETTLRYALQLVLQRPPSDTQLTALRTLLESERAHYTNDPESAKRLTTNPQLPLPTDIAPAELAAWTAVSNVLLNLDGFLSKS
jgi:hypothetical protein